MQQANTRVSRGEVIFFSSGSYSDYGYRGEVIFTRDVDLAELAQEYRKSTNPNTDDYGDDLLGFSGWLVGNGYCLPLECREIHLGEYSTFDDDFLRKSAA